MRHATSQWRTIRCDATDHLAGHATVLIEVGAARLLTDPVLRGRVAYIRRAVPPAPDPGPLDGVLISHLHHDHLDRPSLRRVAGSGVAAVLPSGAARLLSGMRFGGVHEVRPGDALDVGGARIEVVPAWHDGRRLPFPRARCTTRRLRDRRRVVRRRYRPARGHGGAPWQRLRRVAADLGLGSVARSRPSRPPDRRARRRPGAAAHRDPDPLGRSSRSCSRESTGGSCRSRPSASSPMSPRLPRARGSRCSRRAAHWIFRGRCELVAEPALDPLTGSGRRLAAPRARDVGLNRRSSKTSASSRRARSS